MGLLNSKREKELYRQYVEIVCPFIIELETEDNEFPVEIMNEVRAMTTHLARCKLAEDDTAIEQNFTRAEGHLKRAILDCFKYSCLSISLKHLKIRDDYKNADLHIIDNGAFLTTLTNYEIKAKKSLKKAKKIEVKDGVSSDDLYSAYELAWQDTVEAYKYLEQSLPKLEFAKSVADKNKKFAVWGFVVGLLGLIIGVVGIIL